ncbi:MAG: PspC domain-containing protein, partial [Bifidobacterium sp.]|nr:PspC domain-containing protein [Bifidobacterium sp.]
MSNTNQDPRGPQGAQGRPYAPQPGPQAYRQQYQGGQVPPQPQMPTQPPESKFFQWIRSSGLVRTNDRVVAGVCGGIARELGWSVELVRVLMVVAIFFGGFGMALYAMGWALLPDELTGDIPLEQLLAGHWDWSYIGIVLCIIIGIFPGMLFGGVSLLGFLLAVLALYLLVNNGRRRFLARNGAPMGGPAPQGGQGAGRYQPGGYPSTAAPEGNVPKAAAPQGVRPTMACRRRPPTPRGPRRASPIRHPAYRRKAARSRHAPW